MTPQEALQLVDNVFAQVNCNREQQAQLQEAVRVITLAIGQRDLDTKE